MKKSEFVRKMKRAIKIVEERDYTYSCNVLYDIDWKIQRDYREVFARPHDNFLPAAFGLNVSYSKIKEVRLNALSMYMVQALEFGTYKDL